MRDDVEVKKEEKRAVSRVAASTSRISIIKTSLKLFERLSGEGRPHSVVDVHLPPHAGRTI